MHPLLKCLFHFICIRLSPKNVLYPDTCSELKCQSFGWTPIGSIHHFASQVGFSNLETFEKQQGFLKILVGCLLEMEVENPKSFKQEICNPIRRPITNSTKDNISRYHYMDRCLYTFQNKSKHVFLNVIQCPQTHGLQATSGLQVTMRLLTRWCVIPAGIRPVWGYPTFIIFNYPQTVYRYDCHDWED